MAVPLAALALLLIADDVSAQAFCRGDLDRDGVITAADADLLVPVLFVVDLEGVDIETLIRADVNDDGVFTGADVVTILTMDGMPCPTPEPTDTPTSTPTITPIMSPTPTKTRPPTPTATSQCQMQPLTFGATTGSLSEADCVRTFLGQPRFADVYTLSAAPGTAVTVDLTTVQPLVGYLAVIDPAGQFEAIEGVSPIQFTVTTSQPYQIYVTSNPASAVQGGGYTLMLSATPCPTPVALTFPSSKPYTLDGAECPEPAVPSVGTQREPADVFTFTVTSVPTNVSITMQQLSVTDDIFPVMSLIAPDGIELVTQDTNYDCTAPTGTLLCSQIRFLALRTGTYTILATGTGGTGRYSLTVSTPACNPTVLTDIPPDRPLLCPGSSIGCAGALDGNTTHTPCAAPLPSPGSTDDVPEPGSPAQLYTFSANPGDVISLKMTSADAPHLYVLGPAPVNTLVAADNTSSAAQLAATLPLPGTYTIVVANDTALLSDDPPIDYTLLVQKCPVRAGLNPLTGRAATGTFSTLDCPGADDIPYRTYGFSGTAGQFVTTTMTSSNVDSFVRVFAPDGTRVENDDDPFQVLTSDARASRVLPMDGTYIVEVSASPAGPPVDVETLPLPAFTVRARLCATIAAQPGPLSETLQDDDCDLAAGRRGDVYTFPAGTTPAVATVAPPTNGCVVALLGDGSAVPPDGCSTTPVDIPLLGTKMHGFIVAGAQTSTRGSYTAGLSRCPVTTVGFGASVNGTLGGADCADPKGRRADWFLIQAPADVANFNFGIVGAVTAGFPVAGLLWDRFGSVDVVGSFNEDPSGMFANGTNLVSLLRVTGVAPTDSGAYHLDVDMAAFRQ